MLNRIFALTLALAALSAAAAAQGPAEPTGRRDQPKKEAASKSEKAPPPGVSDDELDAQRAQMDGRFAARVAAIKDEADRRQFYHVGAEKKRLEFERHASEERKAFYLYLKSVALDERKGRLADFDEKQEKDRQRFDKEQLAEAKKWFADEIEGNWKSESLMNQEPAAGAAAAVASPAPAAAAPAAAKPRHPVIARKPKPARRRKSRVKRKTTVESDDDSSPSASDMNGEGAAN